MKKPSKRDCAGCRDDYYNYGDTSTTGECWSLKSATFEKARDIPVDLRPPYKHIPITVRPSCYRRPRFVRVQKESLTADGFWK